MYIINTRGCFYNTSKFNYFCDLQMCTKIYSTRKKTNKKRTNKQTQNNTIIINIKGHKTTCTCLEILTYASSSALFNNSYYVQSLLGFTFPFDRWAHPERTVSTIWANGKRTYNWIWWAVMSANVSTKWTVNDT